MTGMELTLGRQLGDLIAEYDTKIENIGAEINTFEEAANDLKSASTISGTWGNVNINTGSIYSGDMKMSLTRSAWLHLYKALQFDRVFTAKDKKLFEQSMTSPPDFNLDNIRGTYGEYIKDPRSSVLRGLAEVFCDLDQSFKSHDKVKIGVQGLPKRVIISGFGWYSGYGQDRIRDILNALAAYQNKPLTEHVELADFVDLAKEEGVAVHNEFRKLYNNKKEADATLTPDRGITLKIFKNGNGHLHFDPETLKDINRALAEYYGDVLADTHEEKPTERAQSTEVSKDLQYYPTPVDVVAHVMRDVYVKDQKVLEPSCGCGRFMDAIREEGGYVVGIEIDQSRVNICRQKGHKVQQGNFLDMEPQPIYDVVIMNPPFYGKHYAKHVDHAYKFLKEGGTLLAILPITAQTDHGLVDGEWRDLPVGSFSESGTNINTTVLKNEEEARGLIE